MTQEPEPEDTPAWLEAAKKSGAGVAGSLLGYAVAGSAGAVVGGATPPVIELALRYVGDQWREQSLKNGERVLAQAASEANLSPEQMAAHLSGRPKRLQLAGLALSAAAMTADEDKLRALARALGASATDDALVDPELLAVTALADMEAPHIKVLQRMEVSAFLGGHWRRINGRRQYGTWRKSALERELPEMETTLEPVLGTLLRHGLLVEPEGDLREALERRDRDVARGSGALWRPPEPTYRISAFGEHCLDLLREIAAEEEDEAGGRQQESGTDGGGTANTDE